MELDIKKAAANLSDGKIIIIPTETVYGIAADARNKSSIEAIYDCKGRNKNKPLQLFLPSIAYIEQYAIIENNSHRLDIEELFKQPSTVILKLRQDTNLADNFNQSADFGGTVGIRICSNKTTQRLLQECGFPLAVTSANISNHNNNPTSVNDVQHEIINRTAGWLRCNDTKSGKPSRVIDFTNPQEKITLR